jgi:hypothetical protein
LRTGRREPECCHSKSAISTPRLVEYRTDDLKGQPTHRCACVDEVLSQLVITVLQDTKFLVHFSLTWFILFSIHPIAIEQTEVRTSFARYCVLPANNQDIVTSGIDPSRQPVVVDDVFSACGCPSRERQRRVAAPACS